MLHPYGYRKLMKLGFGATNAYAFVVVQSMNSWVLGAEGETKVDLSPHSGISLLLNLK